MVSVINTRLREYVKNNIVKMFLVILIFVIGVVAGALAVKLLPIGVHDELVQYLKIFLAQADNGYQGSWAVAGSVVIHYFKVLSIIWLLGFTIIGIPFILFIVFTRGFVIGFTVGLLLNEYVFKGLLFAVMAIVPHNLLVIPIIMLLSVTAIDFSIRLIKRKGRLNNQLWLLSCNYTLVWLAACLGVTASAFIEVFVSPVFIKLIAGLF